jgi:hypothetical protein
VIGRRLSKCLGRGEKNLKATTKILESMALDS